MITHNQALEIILSNCNRLDAELIQLTDSTNRVLAENIHSDINMPPFDKSAVDGFACRKEDLLNELKIIETIAAGQIPQFAIEKNCCSKIMTGAQIPKNTDFVFMIEDSELIDNQTVKFVGNSKSTNICIEGEDIKINDIVLQKGTLIQAFHAGILATVGCWNVPVTKKPKIGILTTGDELIEPHEKLEAAKIRNSNAYQLISSCKSMKIDAKYYGIIQDDPEITYQTIKKAIEENDVIIITGGVSMGEFDFVPKAIEKCGLKILFDSIAIQPGRPLTYATLNNKHCFGLPGNPVSSFVQFELSVKPLIYKLMGFDFRPLSIPMIIDTKFFRKKANRNSVYPVKLTADNKVKAINYHGSAHINAYADAFGFIIVEKGVFEIEEGVTVNVRPI